MYQTADVATSDIPQLILDLTYRVDLIVTLLLFSVGIISAVIVCYLLYRYLIRFFY